LEKAGVDLSEYEAPGGFNKQGQSSSFLSTNGLVVGGAVAAGAVYAGLAALGKGEGIRSQLKYNGFSRIGTAAYMNIATYSMLSLTNGLKYDSPMAVANTAAAIAGTAFTAAYPFAMNKLLRNGDFGDKKFKKSFGSLFSDYRTDSKASATFESVVLGRKALQSTATVLLQSYPTAQMGMLVATNAGYAGSLIYTRPYKLHAVNAVRFGSESLMVLGQAGMMFFPGGSDGSTSETDTGRELFGVDELTAQSPLSAAAFKNIGWSVAGIFTLAYMVTVSSLFLKMSVFGKAKEGKAVSFKKKKKVKKEEEEEEEEEEDSPKKKRKTTFYSEVKGQPPKKRFKRKKKKMMTSDFGGIRHPKYRVKQEGEPERLLMTKNFGGINQPLYPVLAPG